MSKNNILEKAKHFFLKFKKLDNEELKKVSGAGEIEEFGWKSDGYTTPVKEEPKDGEWKFSPMDDKSNK